MISITYVKNKQYGLNLDNFLPSLIKCFYFNASSNVALRIDSDMDPYYKNNKLYFREWLTKIININGVINSRKIDYDEWAEYCDPEHIYFEFFA